MVTRLIDITPRLFRMMRINVEPGNQFYHSQRQDVQQLRIKLGFEADTTTTLNHILPGVKIRSMMEYCTRDDQIDAACDTLSRHCSYFPVIANTMNNFINQGDEVNAMDSCWSSIYWYRKNLVLGPQSSRRDDDPGNQIDKPILQCQSNSYQDSLQICNTFIYNQKGSLALKEFFSSPLGQMNNVTWVQTSRKLDRWKVGGKSKLPANAGFDY